MPIYAYKCGSCGHAKDVLQKISDAPLTVCPACGAAFSKQVTAAGFQLKGSGWYATDFRGRQRPPRRPSRRPARRPTTAKPADGGPQAVRQPARRRRAKTDAPRRSARPAAAARPAPATERRPMLALRKWLLAGLLVIVPVAITARRAALDHRHARPDAADPARRPGTGPPDRLPHPRPRRAADAGHPADRRRRRQQLRRQEAGGLGRPRWSAASRWCARSTPASSRSPTRCSPRAATPSAPRCWCSGRGPTSGPSASSPARPAATWPTTCVGDYVSVYVPTTPNPTGGYFVMLRKSDCIELKMSVDEALKYVISMGVVAPGRPVNQKR